jgi:hypothetical protein
MVTASCCSCTNDLADWSTLPVDVLTLIMQRPDQQQRLGSCALVSSRWAAAAGAATRAPTFQHTLHQRPWQQRDTRAASLQLWLAAHCQHITSLHASAAQPQLLLSLPAMPALDLSVLASTNLQSLELQQLQVPSNNRNHGQLGELHSADATVAVVLLLAQSSCADPSTNATGAVATGRPLG